VWVRFRVSPVSDHAKSWKRAVSAGRLMVAFFRMRPLEECVVIAIG